MPPPRTAASGVVSNGGRIWQIQISREGPWRKRGCREEGRSRPARIRSRRGGGGGTRGEITQEQCRFRLKMLPAMGVHVERLSWGDARGCPGHLEGFLLFTHCSSHLHTPTVLSPPPRLQGQACENKPAPGRKPTGGGRTRMTLSSLDSVRGLAVPHPTPLSLAIGTCPCLSVSSPHPLPPTSGLELSPLLVALLFPNLVHGPAALQLLLILQPH